MSLQLVDEQKFPELVMGADVAVLEFGAAWCPPCKALLPILEELAAELTGELAADVLAVEPAGQTGADVLAVEPAGETGEDVLAVEPAGETGEDVLAVEPAGQTGEDVLAVEPAGQTGEDDIAEESAGQTAADVLAGERRPSVVIAQADADDSPGLASQFGIMSLPTVIVFKRGQPVDKLVGLRPKQVYRTIIDRWASQ